jgi:AraC family transcriptional regulator of arabinose operon
MSTDLTAGYPDAIRHAVTCWKLLRGHAVTPVAMTEAIAFAYGEDSAKLFARLGSMLTPQRLAELYNSQPKMAALKAQWQARFEPVVALDVASANDFILQLNDSVELVDNFFAHRVLSGAHFRSAFPPAADGRIQRPAGMRSGWSLQLTIAGGGVYNCIRQNLAVGCGDMVLVSPDAVHECWRNPQEKIWSSYWIYFPSEKRLLEWLNWREAGPYLYHLRVAGEVFECLAGLFVKSFAVTDLGDKVSTALMLNIIEEILIRAHRVAAERSPAQDARVLNVMEYLNNHLAEPIPVPALAERVGLSRTQLSTLFKQHTGATLLAWRDERRMARACQLLTQTQLSVQVVAGRVGYDDPLYFSRIFSRLVGCSPTAYRQRSGAGRSGQ